jgi:hypothetical protein
VLVFILCEIVYIPIVFENPSSFMFVTFESKHESIFDEGGPSLSAIHLL